MQGEEQDHYEEQDQEHYEESEHEESGQHVEQSEPTSRYLIRSLDGLRVALAGFPANLGVDVGEGVDLVASTVGDLRSLDSIASGFELLIPYSIVEGTRVTIQPLQAAHASER